MTENQTFRVGITPDWGDRYESTLGQAVREVFDPIAGLEHEIMPECPGLVATPEIADRYDAILVLGYYFPKQTLDKVKRLKCLARWGVGYDRIDVEAATANDVLIALTPTTLRRTVSEGALAMLFAISKNLLNLDRNVRAGKWRQGVGADGVLLRDRVLGCIGVGNIGGELVRMAQGLNFSRIIGYDPYCPKQRAEEVGVELVDLDTVLKESDFISLHAPLTPQTENIIDARALSLMKPSAYLINTARGQLVDEDALLAALKERRIAGAALDVLREEPPPVDHPFFELDNVLLAPHWVPMTQENVVGNSLEVCNNIKTVSEGKIPPFLANPQAAEKPSLLAKIAR